MFQLIYIEEEVSHHPQVKTLIRRFSRVPQINIERYTEVFNPKGQNFRIQKQHPCLILAKKHHNWILETPPTYGIGTPKNFYFSHLLNCPYDCRYCFLQGMFASAHYVYFVNDEDFKKAITEKQDVNTTFFTGYDCDSLALESITGFAKDFLPFIKTSPALFEFRTKSTQIDSFLKQSPLANVVIAFTLTAHEELEHRAPSLEKRLQAMQELQKRGWQLGLRFDPMIYETCFEERYSTFFEKVFSALITDMIHSVSLGGFRVPSKVFKKMIKLYPEEPLFVKKGDDEKLLSFCEEKILNYIPKNKYFPCDVKTDSCYWSQSGNWKNGLPLAH